ncbi:hypothetical protein SAMN05661008_01604 [Alkalithermobacter thermoalcaliphilus JW-YL-7 = DSM 7308]|uniref:Uncharacterized protein n=1 Tax=Alkalithermobacter thermoalcaliphilus JW-YL-7 = DSM 7308 TaxID=1121328 RepID=A0A150FSV2_CLOPD|nr:hypothetical protein JWYL7_1757 [[Clostridium] paradoxum JW-YL-7 = DSM 7308]SHL17847.1 hypothetical protein SAMN05661008_01604 [[Clostridium] paradoxum JW-YL-7 = DSM 7308]
MFYYCIECKRIFSDFEKCTYCSSSNIKKLSLNSPVNVIGSKIKGRVLKIKDDNIRLLYVDEHKNKLIKEFSHDKLRKIL